MTVSQLQLPVSVPNLAKDRQWDRKKRPLKSPEKNVPEARNASKDNQNRK